MTHVEAIKRHIAVITELRRQGVSIPACYGDECAVCRAIAGLSSPGDDFDDEPKTERAILADFLPWR